jgi:DNA-binding response OmpR family regulator
MRLASDALAGRRVLVLEDEFLIAMDIEQLCRDQGAEDVVILRSLDETAEAVAQRFDVAVLDLMLDGESTIGFARELRERGVPFVIASGYADFDEVAAAVPGVTVVGKPYDGAELMDAVAAALALSGSV